ncbi:MAG: TadE/TadG family type IV pilus assembly protein [Lentisphaeria bacterium]|nr:TadE/TadG family type IV pilus assembly protein [Lentisphaeria bacterium]
MAPDGGKRNTWWRSDQGSVTLEFVLAFPVVLTLIMGAAQFGHIWMARQVVSYAAFAAGRAALICHDSERDQACRQAAEEVCAWVSIGQASGEAEKKIPGWGKIPGSGAVNRKTTVKIDDVDDWTVKVTVDFDFALVMPIAGAVIGWAVNPYEWTERRADMTGDAHRHQDSIGYPHLRFSETSIVCKPYKTMPKNNLPSGGW